MAEATKKAAFPASNGVVQIACERCGDVLTAFAMLTEAGGEWRGSIRCGHCGQSYALVVGRDEAL